MEYYTQNAFMAVMSLATIESSYVFMHDNAPTHRALATQEKLAYLGFQCLDHPPFSPDLAPSDYHLFPGLKEKNN